MSNETSETNIMNEITIKRGRGRPKGTGNIEVSLGEIIDRLGNDRQAMIPVKHLWWAGSSVKNSIPKEIENQLQEEESRIEFSIS